ncbi:MAG TPA: SHOCT domain-containing protein [Candidatus Methanoperedenaceae archaeon]|nr:SHOCT domain-containing protein [Candidatus Methanoperedenaceae archaeon]
MLVFWILIIIGLVLLTKYLWEGGGARRGQETALEILKSRYARGEIGKEEFEAKKKDLS